MVVGITNWTSSIQAAWISQNSTDFVEPNAAARDIKFFTASQRNNSETLELIGHREDSEAFQHSTAPESQCLR